MLKDIQREMGGVENVEKLMGETAEAIAYQRVRFFFSCALLLFSSWLTRWGNNRR